MIDLHIHTKFSDGTDDCITILKKAEQLELSYISITDHNTCKAYNELKNIQWKKYYSGKIICGVELNTKILGIPIEVLGYGVDPDIIDSNTKNMYLSSEERNRLEIERLYNRCQESGVILNSDFLNSFNANMYASKYLHQSMREHIENKKLIDEDAWQDSNIFYRKYMSNPKSLFYIDMGDILPDFNDVAKLIKKANGFIFIPHIFEYRDNASIILDDILANYKIDGIECYYTTFTKKQTNSLKKICDQYSLYQSGGSDYHGSFKPLVEMGIGLSNLKITEPIIDNWKNKVKKLS